MAAEAGISMKLKTIVDAIETLEIKGSLDHEVTGIAFDSRRVKPGTVFAALKGANCDGYDFIGDAVERGAVAVLSETNGISNKEVTSIRVADCRLAVAAAAARYHNNPSERMKMIGITGTNGKTTVAYMVREILAKTGMAPGLIGTVGYELGDRVIPAGRTTPEAPELYELLSLMEDAGRKSVVMEVSSHALAQKRVWGIGYDVAVFTNLTRDHLDYHGDMESYFEVKKMLFDNLGSSGKRTTAIVNLDDSWGRKIAEPGNFEVEILGYGLEAGLVVTARNIRSSVAGNTFEAVTPWGRQEVTIQLLGVYNVLNSLAAIATSCVLGADLKTCAESLAAMKAVPGRLELIDSNRNFRVFVDYAHTEDALRHVLETLREITEGKLIVVFGCGGDRDRAKRPTMGRAASEIADYSIITSDNPRKEDPRKIIQEIEAGMIEGSMCEVIEDREEAIKTAIAKATRTDVVLVAGKGHENYQQLANTTLPFDDREVVRRHLN